MQVEADDDGASPASRQSPAGRWSPRATSVRRAGATWAGP